MQRYVHHAAADLLEPSLHYTVSATKNMEWSDFLERFVRLFPRAGIPNNVRPFFDNTLPEAVAGESRARSSGWIRSALPLYYRRAANSTEAMAALLEAVKAVLLQLQEVMHERLGAQLKSQPSGQRAFDGTFEALLDGSKHDAVVMAVLTEDAVFSDYVRRLVDNGLATDSGGGGGGGGAGSGVGDGGGGGDDSGDAGGDAGDGADGADSGDGSNIVVHGETVLQLLQPPLHSDRRSSHGSLSIVEGGGGDGDVGSGSAAARAGRNSQNLVVQFPSATEELRVRYTPQLAASCQWLLDKVDGSGRGDGDGSSGGGVRVAVHDIPGNDPFEKIAVAHELLRLGVAKVAPRQ